LLQRNKDCLCRRIFIPIVFIIKKNQPAIFLSFFSPCFLSAHISITNNENIEICIQVGVLIEEPFPNLSLDELCKQFHASIEDIMSVHNMVRRRIQAKIKDLDKREVIDERLNMF
jgi:predicted nucleotide-binding protein (sugar kinase/HSP70/actin superfamily)